MEKKKLKIPTAIIILILLVITAAVSLTAYAYSYFIDFNYNLSAHADILSVVTMGTEITVLRKSVTIKATEADIILVADSNGLTLNGEAADRCVEFSNDGGVTVRYRLVFIGLALTGDSTQFTASENIVAVLKAAVREAEIVDSAVTVSYKNSYVSTARELELLNLQSNYNNIFELAGHANSRIVIAAAVYFIDNVEIATAFIVNHPCSLDILDTTLDLTADLTIFHSYPGNYYLENSGGGAVAGSGRLIMKTPKAYFLINAGLRAAISARLTEIYDLDAYGGLLIEDALNFAVALMPEKIYGDMVLQQSFQTFGVKFSYFVLTPEERPFTGKVTSSGSVNDRLLRAPETVMYTIRIYATKDAAEDFRQVTLRVIGTNEKAILDSLLETISGEITSAYIFTDINLLSAVTEAFNAGGLQSSIHFKISESDEVSPDDENALKLFINGRIPSRIIPAAGEEEERIEYLSEAEITYLGGKCYWEDEEITSLYIRRGTVTISKNVDIILTSNGVSSYEIISLALPNLAEVLYYLKSSSPIFLTSADYPLLSVPAGNTGIFIGEDKLTSSTLGLTKIDFELVQFTLDEGELLKQIIPYGREGHDDGNLYLFNLIEDRHELSFNREVFSIFDLPENIYLEYTCTLNDGTECVFLIKVLATLADDGAISQQFESNNPFDELFVSTDTNWLEGGEFTVPISATQFYAKIEILSVGGQLYDKNYAYNMCYIANDDSDPERLVFDSLEDSYYYKRINFVTDLRYVPDKDTNVKVRCYYYNKLAETTGEEESGEIVFTQEYTIIIPGLFKCGDPSSLGANETPFVFYDSLFYEMTIILFDFYYGESAKLYVSTFSTGTKLLLSNSANAVLDLEYPRLLEPQIGFIYNGDEIDITGIQRLRNVPSIVLDGFAVSNVSVLSLMTGSALKRLHLNGCSITDNEIYSSPSAQWSYIYEIHLYDLGLSGNSITRTDFLVSRTVKTFDMSGQRDSGGTPCLIDIAGLVSIKDLETLRINDNGIYRFEVLKLFNKLTTVYLYNNRLSDETINSADIIGSSAGFTAYGTNGLTNIPNFVWIIKDKSAKIYADAAADASFITINHFAVPALFSAGGSITAEMEEGCVALNSFACPTEIYAGGQALLENDMVNLTITVGGGGASGGVGSGGSSTYTFKFFNLSTKIVTSQLVLMQNYSVAAFVNGTLNSPIKCSYIVSIVNSLGKVIAMREFVVDVYCNYTLI